MGLQMPLPKINYFVVIICAYGYDNPTGAIVKLLPNLEVVFYF
jgi:hypothetical protein